MKLIIFVINEAFWRETEKTVYDKNRLLFGEICNVPRDLGSPLTMVIWERVFCYG